MPGVPPEALLSTAQVARVLGIKPQSVYAYASRGRLHPVRVQGRRGSFYAADEVGAVRDSGRSPDTGLAERIQTSISLIESDRLSYRGHDAIRLAGTETFEGVCGLLWQAPGADFPTAAIPELVGLPSAARGIDRIRLGVGLDAATPATPGGGGQPAEIGAARSTMAAAVQALAPGAPLSGALARRLWIALSGKRFDRVKAGLLEQTLIVLADHELAGSTTTARVAASTRANIHGVLLAALGALDSPLHGGASTVVRRLVTAATIDAGAVLAEYAGSPRAAPGFGHLVYVESDPRAEFLLRQANTALAGSSRRIDAVLRSANQLVEIWGERRGWFPNVDFALAVLTEALALPVDAGETIFAIARMSGWTAHALEEYAEPPMRFRLRAVYVGERSR